MKNTQHKKVKEFSKIMAVLAVAMWLIANIFGLLMMAITLDLSPLAFVLPSVDAVVAVVLGFYYWKARAENQIKLKRAYKELAEAPDLNNNGGIENDLL